MGGNTFEQMTPTTFTVNSARPWSLAVVTRTLRGQSNSTASCSFTWVWLSTCCVSTLNTAHIE